MPKDELRKRDFDITIRVGGYIDTPDKAEVTRFAEAVVRKLENDLFHVSLREIRELENA